MDTTSSGKLFEIARNSFPGGVNSPVRAWRGVGGEPLFIAYGAGSSITDADGNAFLDYVGSWGPLILGHAHPRVVVAIQDAAACGSSYGAPCALEIELGRRIINAVPSITMLRFVNSGTEATMSALRLARAFTGRDVILKFDGGYHGHADFLLAKAGSGVATLGLPDSAGVPSAVARYTLTVPYNDLDAVAEIFERHHNKVAAVIVEPVAGNMGVVPPRPGFLQGLREITRDASALLIFDEVMTGFRVAWNGAQGLYGVTPDLTCLGKIIGGGLPVGAYGGRRDIMDRLSPVGPVYQAGTLSGNPLAMACGLATLRTLKESNPYPSLESETKRLCDGLDAAATAAGLPHTIAQVGSMFTLFFHGERVSNYTEAMRCDTQRFAKYFWGMIDAGVYLPCSQFEANFVSAAHSTAEVDATIDAAKSVLPRVAPAAC